MQTNAVSGKELDQAKRFEQALSTQPPEVQTAVCLISKNVLNGCSWEICRYDPEIRRMYDNFRQSKVCSIQEITYDHKKKDNAHPQGYLVYMQMNKLLDILVDKNGGPLRMADIQLANKHRQEAVEALTKRLLSGYKGKIGIFCTNDSQTITINGNVLPAYAVTLHELCIACQEVGYGIVVSGEPRDPQQVLQREDAVIKSLIVAPSSNALILEVAPMAQGKGKH